jgi:hypothetical protein
MKLEKQIDLLREALSESLAHWNLTRDRGYAVPLPRRIEMMAENALVQTSPESLGAPPVPPAPDRFPIFWKCMALAVFLVILNVVGWSKIISRNIDDDTFHAEQVLWWSRRNTSQANAALARAIPDAEEGRP